MAFVDFYQQSTLFNLPPHHPDPPPDLLQGSATRSVAIGNPADDLEDHSVFVDIEIFIKSVLHAPADWKAEWGSIIHSVKRNPDFMKHYLNYRTHHKKCAEREESRYKLLLLMNDVIVRVAFPATLYRDTPSTPLQLTQLVHVVDDGSSDCVLNEANSIPRLITKGKVTRIPYVYFWLTGNRRKYILRPLLANFTW